MITRRPLLRLALRHGRKHFGSTLLLVFGIALGVSVVISVALAGKSVSRSFALTTGALYGEATHQILGSGPFISPLVYRLLRTELGVFTSTPVLDVVGGIGKAKQKVRILGIDPVSAAQFRVETDLEDGLSGSCFPQGRDVMLSRALAENLGVFAGATVMLAMGEKTFPVRVGCVTNRGVLGASEMVFADIALVSDLAGTQGDINRIDLKLKEDVAERLAAVLPQGVYLKSLSSSRSSRRALSMAFETNVTAFGTLALFMGMFLIYSTVSFSVERRLKQVAILKALGASPRDLFRMVLAETAIYTFAGVVLGMALGTLLGRVTVGLVTVTVSELYYDLVAKEAALSPVVYLRGVIMGCVAAFVAATPAALSAARQAPVTTIVEGGQKRSVKGLFLWGAGFTLLALVAVWIPSNGLAFAFLGLFFLLAGAALCVPLGLSVLGAFFKVGASRFPFTLRASFRRTAGTDKGNSLTVATLMVVMAATLGVGLMTGSFRSAVKEWIGRNMPGDIQVSTGVGGGRHLPEGLALYMESRAGVRKVVPYTVRPVQTWAGETMLFSYSGTMPKQKWVWHESGEGVYVSEVFARLSGVERGSVVMMETARGEKSLPVRGVLTDFFTGSGRIIVTRRLYEMLWEDFGYTDLQLFAEPGMEEEILQSVESLAHPYGLTVRRGRKIREQTLVIFDRTFRIAGALQILIALTAVVGVFAAFTSRVSSRYHETGVLRAMGAEPFRVRRLFVAEFLFLSFFAALFALPLGLTLSIYLIDVINTRSFGWSYDLVISFFQVLFCLALPFAAALPAGLIPAHRAATASVSDALRVE
ncbi:MAG: FtsX-like permease family protein [Desulfobacterales bacterium]|nr:FtsX-like permease family protein [Desulfobacterales bacterium]